MENRANTPIKNKAAIKLLRLKLTDCYGLHYQTTAKFELHVSVCAPKKAMSDYHGLNSRTAFENTPESSLNYTFLKV